MSTVLVVEDHEDYRELLLELLRLEGWTAVGAKNAEIAVDIAERQAVDVVLSDLILPGTDGRALEGIFRSNPALASIAFVFMTGYVAAGHTGAGSQVLLKPFSIEQLRGALKAALESAAAASAAKSAR